MPIDDCVKAYIRQMVNDGINNLLKSGVTLRFTSNGSCVPGSHSHLLSINDTSPINEITATSSVQFVSLVCIHWLTRKS